MFEHPFEAGGAAGFEKHEIARAGAPGQQGGGGGGVGHVVDLLQTTLAGGSGHEAGFLSAHGDQHVDPGFGGLP